jgi:hypothetical protein
MEKKTTSATPDFARKVAVEAHGAQTYGPDLPFHYHLDDVERWLRLHGFGEDDVLQVAYLHDVLEDTPLTAEHLRGMGFSEDVVKAVEFCTDEIGPNRKTRKMLTYTRMRAAIDAAGIDMPWWLILGILVKVADRLANIDSCSHQGFARIFGMYLKEAKVFRDTLFVPGLCSHFWREYDWMLQDGVPRPNPAEAEAQTFQEVYGSYGSQPEVGAVTPEDMTPKL